MTSFWRLSKMFKFQKFLKYMLFMAFFVFWILLMSSKICHNMSNKGSNNYFSKKTVDFRQRKNFKLRQKSFLFHDDVIKNNDQIIILIMWLMLKFLLKSKNLLYQVSCDLGALNSFYSGFFDADQKALLPFKSSKKPGCYRIKLLDKRAHEIMKRFKIWDLIIYWKVTMLCSPYAVVLIIFCFFEKSFF